MNDLARSANQDKGHASRSAQSLVDRGLVGKSASASDGRGVTLTLTRKGKGLHAKTMRLIAARNDAVFAPLTAAERSTLGDLLDRVAEGLHGGVSASGDGWIDDVLHFWFDTLRPRDWWGRSVGVDDHVREAFATLLDDLTAAPPDPRLLDGRGHVAAVLVFDQFPRNLFRGSARAYATDPHALSLALHAIDRTLDAPLTQPQRQFLYMPLMHSEDPGVQKRSVAQFACLDDPRASRSAREHHDTIRRFGRFPSRNAALGRSSTADECDWLLGSRGGPA